MVHTNTADPEALLPATTTLNNTIPLHPSKAPACGVVGGDGLTSITI